jgi:F0F1-type ATP synthase delta subunit
MTDSRYQQIFNYASAFFRTIGAEFVRHEYNIITEASINLSRADVFSLFCTLSAITDKEKRKQCLERLLATLSLPVQFVPLCALLLTQRQIDLLPTILARLLQLSDDAENIMPISLESSAVLSDELKNKLCTMLAQKQNKNIKITSERQTNKLIAGIRLQGSNFRWERSIQKQIRSIFETLKEKVLYYE